MHATGGRDDKTQRSLPHTLATKGQSGAGHTFTHLTFLCLQDKDGRKQAQAEHNGSVLKQDNQTHTSGTAGESTPRPAATTRAADPGNPEVSSWYEQTFKGNKNNLANNGKRRTTEKTNPPTADDEPKTDNGKAHRAQPTNQQSRLPPRPPFFQVEAERLQLLDGSSGSRRGRGGGDGNSTYGALRSGGLSQK